MSDHDLKSISSATGSFQALRFRSAQAPQQAQPPGEAETPPDRAAPLPPPREPDLEALAAKLNIASQSIGNDLRFKIDMNSGQSIIQVLDRETGEIIREIPPEKAAIRLADNGDLELRLYDRVV